MPGAIDASRLRATLNLNARSAPQGLLLQVIDVPAGIKAVEVLSMRKYPPTMNVDRILPTLDPNAQINREARIEIVDVPDGIKAAEIVKWGMPQRTKPNEPMLTPSERQSLREEMLANSELLRDRFRKNPALKS